MKKIFTLLSILIVIADLSLFSQIQTNMYYRGDMNAWGSAAMTYRGLGTANWSVSILSDGDDATSEFKFDNTTNWSGLNWSRGDVISLDSYTIFYDPNGGNGNFSETNTKYYTLTIKDVGSGNSDGFVMETSGNPVTISTVSQVGNLNDVTFYASSAAQTVNITISGSKSTEEKIYVRYTNDNWSTDNFIVATGSGTSYSAEIPTQSIGATVVYYVFTTTLAYSGGGDLDNYTDLCTINYENNSGSNYTYVVGRATTQAGNWNTTATWLDGAVPTGSTDDVIIANDVTIDEVGATDAECDDLTIASGATLTLDNSGVIKHTIHGTVVIFGNAVINDGSFFDITKKLKIKSTGNLTLKSGGELTVDNNTTNDGTFTIESTSSGTGSFISLGTTTNSGTNTIQRYMTQYSGSGDGWHFLSSPVSGFTIGGSDFAPTSGDDDLYKYDETAASLNWLNYTGGTFGDTEFEVGLGYLSAYKTTATKSFTGSINTGSTAKSISFTSGTPGEGWNLLGNPYTSALDWDLLTRTGSIDGSVYVIQSSTGDYITWNGSIGDLTNGIIPSMQGYFVHCTATGQTVTMESGDQVHSSTNFYKSGTTLEANTFKVSVSKEGYSNNTYIQIREDASEIFDNKIDAYKLFGYSQNPQIYTSDNNDLYSINCLPMDMESYNLVLGVKAFSEDIYAINFEGIENILDHYTLKLHDLKTNTIVPITDALEYPFSFHDGDNEQRFEIQFNSITGVEEDIANNWGIIFTNRSDIVVKTINNSSINGKLTVSNLLGQNLLTRNLMKSPEHVINTDLNAGIYIVTIISNEGLRLSQKVIISN